MESIPDRHYHPISLSCVPDLFSPPSFVVRFSQVQRSGPAQVHAVTSEDKSSSYRPLNFREIRKKDLLGDAKPILFQGEIQRLRGERIGRNPKLGKIQVPNLNLTTINMKGFTRAVNRDGWSSMLNTDIRSSQIGVLGLTTILCVEITDRRQSVLPPSYLLSLFHLQERRNRYWKRIKIGSPPKEM